MAGRPLFSKRTVISGSSTAAAVLLVLGILVFLGLLAHRYHLRWDLTRDQSQSLSAITKALLQEVNKPLAMTGFFPGGEGERQKAKDLLQTYVYANRNLSFQFMDPDREPLKAREAGYRFPGNILLEYDGRRQMADRPEEEAVTEALRKILKTERKKLFFLTGHGERSIANAKQSGLQQANSALANEGFEVEELNLLTRKEVPPEAAVLIIPGPQKPLLPPEVAALQQYLDRGGKLLVLLEPFQDGGLQDFLGRYGIGLDDGLILDQNQISQALGASAVMPLVVQYGAHRITRDFTNIVTIYPMARPLILNQEVKGASLIPLASTTATSWEKLGQAWIKSGKADFDSQKDRKGPFTLGVLAEIRLGVKTPEGKTPPPPPGGAPPPDDSPKAFLTVFGDVDFATNGYFNLSGNGDLFLNIVNFLAAEEKQIVIRKGDQKSQPLTLTGLQAWVILAGSVVALPLLMLAGGVRAYLRRRTRR